MQKELVKLLEQYVKKEINFEDYHIKHQQIIENYQILMNSNSTELK
jgi:hypothetical protein